MSNFLFTARFAFKNMKCLVFQTFLFLVLLLSGAFFSLFPVMIMKETIDSAVSGNGNIVIKFGALYLLFQIVGNFIRSLNQYLVAYKQNVLSKNLQVNVYDAVTQISLKTLEQGRIGPLITTVITDTELLGEGYYIAIVGISEELINLIIALIFMLILNPVLTSIIIPLSFVTAVISRVIADKSRANQEQKRDKATELWKAFYEGIKGINVLKSTNSFANYRKYIYKSTEEVNKINKERNVLDFWSDYLSITVFMVSLGVILIVSSHLVLKGMISVGVLTAILMYNHMLIDPLVKIVDHVKSKAQQDISVDRIRKLFQFSEKTVANKETTLVDQIKVSDISFSYECEKIIENCSVEFRVGVFSCIVGRTGSGKSTLVKLLTGLYQPDLGSIDYYLNNKKIKSNQIPGIGLALQDGYLFDLSIRDNLMLANVSLSDTEYEQIVKTCCLEELLSQIGDKSIGENGGKISGGEKSRLRIARALAANDTSILIFDEISSSLDINTFRSVMNNLEKYKKDKICIFIEHNTEALFYMDEIYNLEDGKLKSIVSNTKS